LDNKTLKRIADNIRVLAASMPEAAVSGHPGGAMGGADFMAILYTEFLKFDPKNKDWFLRDRFFLDPGHMSPMLYATLSLFDSFSMNDLSRFRQWDSPTPGHPEVDFHLGIENTSGPLGQGHGMAAGAAIAERFLVARFGETVGHKTYTYISDGGIQEEISQGVGRLAGHLGLSNLVMFYDSNDIQLSSKTEEVTSEDTKAKYEAWGWKVMEVDGHNFDELRAALNFAKAETEKPTLIIGKTIMGYGATLEDGTSFERKVKTHGQPLSKAGASIAKTIEKLGGDPKNPFQIYADVAKAIQDVKHQLSVAAQERRREHEVWEQKNPVLAQKLQDFIDLKLNVDFGAIAQAANQATRAASRAVLAQLASSVENLIVTSADLCDSDYTDGFLKKSKAFKKGDFSGAFLQAGVCELTMAVIMNGIALHGGVRAAGGTFFVFSDYQKPAYRLSALMELPVIYIWTHDAFRVGEDGPTHQPVEQEAQVRLMEKMKNLEGHRSFLVLRPGDVHETSVAWQMALENTKTPSCLILTRQNVKDLPNSNYTTALQAQKGAYIAKAAKGEPKLVLVANGSEVSLLVEASEKLEAKGISCQVVSAISEGLFREQSADYQAKVLPFGVPTLGWTAGLPVNMMGLVGPLGAVEGMTRFGASAPYTVLDEKFGFTADHVVARAEKYLGEFKALVTRISAIKI
jgi:transketolase